MTNIISFNMLGCFHKDKNEVLSAVMKVVKTSFPHIICLHPQESYQKFSGMIFISNYENQRP